MPVVNIEFSVEMSGYNNKKSEKSEREKTLRSLFSLGQTEIINNGMESNEKINMNWRRKLSN